MISKEPRIDTAELIITTEPYSLGISFKNISSTMCFVDKVEMQQLLDLDNKTEENRNINNSMDECLILIEEEVEGIDPTHKNSVLSRVKNILHTYGRCIHETK